MAPTILYTVQAENYANIYQLAYTQITNNNIKAFLHYHFSTS